MAESVSGLPSVSVRNSPQLSVGNAPVLVKGEMGNLYGFLAENEGGSDVFLLFFDAAAAIDVTLGVSTPKFVHKARVNSPVGRDPVNTPYDFFEKGCVVAITTTRAGIADPGFTIPVKFWYQAK